MQILVTASRNTTADNAPMPAFLSFTWEILRNSWLLAITWARHCSFRQLENETMDTSYLPLCFSAYEMKWRYLFKKICIQKKKILKTKKCLNWVFKIARTQVGRRWGLEEAWLNHREEKMKMYSWKFQFLHCICCVCWMNEWGRKIRLRYTVSWGIWMPIWTFIQWFSNVQNGLGLGRNP